MLGEAPRKADLYSIHWTSLQIVAALLLAIVTATSAVAQTPAPESAPVETFRPAVPRSGGVPVDAALTPTEYRIGVDDVISINVLQAPELNASVRVAEAGDVSLALIGVIHAATLTTRELEDAIKARLRASFIRDPEVTVLVTEVRSHGVSVVGAVRRPGLIQVRGRSTLLEVLSLAGGLDETAGEFAMVVRPEGNSTRTIEIKLKELLAADVSANIQLLPGDVVNVQKAALIYVMGAVNKPGAFAIRGNDRITVLRALAYGEGPAFVASKSEAFLLRVNESGQQVEVPINLDLILAGTSPDIEMKAQDLLFVPTSGVKTTGRNIADYLAKIISLRTFVPF